jgi:hypothetical protein
LQVGLQANVPQPYDDDDDGADHNTTADDIEAALTDLQVYRYWCFTDYLQDIQDF